MPAVATGDGSCIVLSKTGNGNKCRFPRTVSTNQCSTKVFVGGIGVVRKDDLVIPHSKSGCVPDVSVLTTFSSKVFVEGKGLGRIGDKYTSDNIITSGSSFVFAGG